MKLSVTAAVYTLIVTATTVTSTHPECSIVLHLQEKENECKLKMEAAATATLQAAAAMATLQDVANRTAGCVSQWDGVSCWPAASEGDVVSVLCPSLLRPQTPAAAISRRCTERGWSDPSVSYYDACYHQALDEDEDEDVATKRSFFAALRTAYSVGYGVSLAALLAAALTFCCCRKLLCSRNCVHLNLFVTFMLRSLAVFLKDNELFADRSTDHCSVSTLRCKAAVTFFHLCVLWNFSWLLVEGLYLQTLLLTFTQTRTLLWTFGAVGWGAPCVIAAIWAVMKTQLDDEGCWDDLESRLWWIIKTPILLSIFTNFVIFLNIMKIIAQKTTASNPAESQLHRTLARSTLLLTPLFGLHYVVFALIPDHVGVGPRLFLELVLGSFQGFIVALLYCFLNGEVRKEIRRVMRSWWPETRTNAINLPTQEFVP